MGGMTFRPEDWRRARDAWVDGEFGSAWRPYRELAASRGFMFPPSGGVYDEWDQEHPSQRAIVWRAIEETPELLRTCISRARSWNDVVRALTGERDQWRARQREETPRERFEPSRAGAGSIIATLAGAAMSHRLAQLDAVADAAREIVRLGNQQGIDDSEWELAMASLEGMLLALGDES